MLLTNIDIEIRKWLLERSLPIHFYSEGLFHARAVVQQLAQDTLQIINSANLPVDSTGNVELPDDFDDDLMVCIPSGQSLIQLPKQDWITPLRLHDTTSGEFVPYSQNTSDNSNEVFVNDLSFGFSGRWSMYWNVDSYGGNTGRQFGMVGGTRAGYKVFKGQRRIQMSEGFADSNVVLLYISDGQQADNASQIDTKASRAITTYIDWQRSPNATNEKSPEARTFWNQKRRLKTLLNPLTKIDILNIFRSGYTAAPKT